jgi:hypothetical protein
MTEYDVQDVINAECTLTPFRCRFCGSHEVVYHQYIGDASCQECGFWQLEDFDYVALKLEKILGAMENYRTDWGSKIEKKNDFYRILVMEISQLREALNQLQEKKRIEFEGFDDHYKELIKTLVTTKEVKYGNWGIKFERG